MKKLLAFILTAIMLAGICGAALAEDAVTPVPVVADEAAVPYLNGGATFVSGAVDVFITSAADTTCYYKIGASRKTVGVFYKGETGNPIGSYFDGSLENGALVMTFGENLDFVSGTLLTGSKVTVPVVPGEAALLEVIAYKDGVASVVYTHEFRGVVAGSNLLQAVYDASGYFISLGELGFKSSGVMDVDYVQYPLGVYNYKIFCWDENYVPLYDAVVIK